jgi:hypothetical protein
MEEELRANLVQQASQWQGRVVSMNTILHGLEEVRFAGDLVKQPYRERGTLPAG